MSSNWRVGILKDLVTLQRGHDLPERDRNPGSVPVMGSAGHNGFHNKALVNGPGIVIGRSGASFGQVHFCQQDYWPHNTALYVTNFQGNDPSFVYYYLKNIDFARFNSGSAQPSLNRNYIYPIPVQIPSVEIQRKISEIICSLDRKIELNRQMNQTLEAMAQAIFQSWFVDFEPVKAKQKAKAAGKSAAYIEMAAIVALSGKSEDAIRELSAEVRSGLAEIAGLFSDELVESELGLIPEGWEVKNLGGLTNYLQRGIQPKYLDEGGVLVINQKCIRDRQINIEKARRHDQLKKAINDRELRLGDILVNSTGTGTLGRIAQVLYLAETTIVDSHITIVRPNPDSATVHYLGLNLIRREAEVESLGRGSTGQTELSRSSLDSLAVVLPCIRLQNRFDDQVSGLRDKIIANELQSKTLAELRDSLLPKLLSGELTLPAA